MDQPLSILIVDDDAVDRMAVQRALRVAGLEVQLHEARDEQSALQALRTTLFDCVFLDYQLAAGDGLSVLRQSRSEGIKTPIVVLTGQGDELVAVEIMKAGASDYLPKSRLSPESLQQSLRTAMRLHRAEREAERANEALRFLAEASALLASSLDYPTTIVRVAELTVPYLGEYCAIHILERDGSFPRVASVHVDPVEEGRLVQVATRYPLPPDFPHGYPKVLQSGVADWRPTLEDEFLQSVAQNEEHLALLRSLNISAYISVPLLVRGKTIGAITLLTFHGQRQYTEADVELARELARRAASAIDNALLYREAQDAIRMRDAFISVASHELKTPLTTLHGYAQLLLRRARRDETLNPRHLQSAEMIAEQSLRLNRMIESLLDISRLESGQLSIAMQEVELGALFQRLEAEIRPTLHQHTLALHLPPHPLYLAGDELRLEQVFQNLIQNAVKYSPQGGAIRLYLDREGALARVRVCDEGLGIPSDALPHLFERFYRASSREIQSISGVGLGLFVVKEIVSLHGGQVEVESQEGKGSTFTVWLPLNGLEGRDE